MRTVGQLAGLALVGEGSGEKLGRVQDVVFEHTTGRITAFLVTTGKLFAHPQVLPRLFVRSLGSDALLVETGHVLEDAKNDPTEEGVLSARSLDDRPVLNDSGTYLGKVSDVLVDEANLAVTALLINTGMVDSVLHGKPILPLTMVNVIGQASIVVPTSFEVTTADKHR